MDYPRAMEIIHEIEQRHDVNAIRYKGVCIWPYLRNIAWRGMYHAMVADDESIAQPLSPVSCTQWW